MDDILNLKTEEIAGLCFDCSCGRRHEVGIRNIIAGTGVLGRITEVASEFKHGRIFIIADNNTYSICSKNIEELLCQKGFDAYSYVFTGEHPLVPDEKALGRLIIEVAENTSLIVAVGSGTINDLARMVSFKLAIPYVIIGTAPSMDGYASVVSPLIVGGTKVTFQAVYPYAIIADANILKEAPMQMLQAGFGDILGKLTALADWELARRLNNEYYCQTTVNVVKTALLKCRNNIEGMVRRDETAIMYLMEALILSGVAIGLIGNSRPASGAEHHMAHYWEVDAIKQGIDHPLHGNSVGTAAVVVSMLYKMMKERLPAGMETPEPEEIIGLLERTGAAADPAKLGIDKELFRRSVIHAMEIRPRFTIFNFTQEAGLLVKYADELTQRFYA